jgi:DNA-binding IclR family transcriptional regulator
MSNYALSKALFVLRQFDALCPEWGVTDLSERTGLSVSHVSKILREFRNNGFLVQDPQSRRYRVGPQALTLGAGYHSGSDVIRRADKFIHRLVQRTDATATLNVIEGSRILFVAAWGNGHPPHFSWPVGSYIPLHATAAGKVAAAFSVPDSQSTPIDACDLRTFTPATICDLPSLLKQFSNVRRQGVAYTLGESTYGLAAVAAPVLGTDDHVIGAISVLMSVDRARDGACSATIAAALRETARDVSRAIGATHYPYAAAA